jgi:hypothetical protein
MDDRSHMSATGKPTPGAPQKITLEIPLDAIGPVTVTGPPPALVSPDVNPEHVGQSRNGLADVMRAMRAHPTWGPRVIVLSRKRLFVAPDDVIAFMRQHYAAAVTAPPTDEIGVMQAEIERELGIVPVPRPRAARRAR